MLVLRDTYISYISRCLNEHIVRLANQEGGYKGRLWEERNNSQTLLDERVLQTCMTYVDLNSIRAVD